MSLTGKVQPYKAGFGPMMPDVWHLPFPNDLHGVTQQDAVRASLVAVVAFFVGGLLCTYFILPLLF